MKKRVIFVDDEPMVLQMFQTLFQRLCADWEMDFVSNGFEALERMAHAPYDVIVCDMRMPGMTGAELLNEVMRRHPGTARIILSGYSDQDLVRKCVGATHQFLVKPCNVMTLRAALLRVCSFQEWVQNEQLKALFGGIDSLPSLPSLYFRILEELQSPNASVDRIGELIARDSGMTPKLLQLVNSAFFGSARQVMHPSEAVQILGVSIVRTLALSLHVFTSFEHVRIDSYPTERLWQHSFATGMAARRIMELEHAEESLVEAAFTAGLLHDAGRLLLAWKAPAQYREAMKLARDQSWPAWKAEQEVFGTTHAEAGAYLFGLWGLPVSIVEAVAFQHRPRERLPKNFGPITAVHVADAFDREANTDLGDFVVSGLDIEYLREIGVVERLDLWREICFSMIGA
jgi:HD-like signal output (HDOD) protein